VARLPHRCPVFLNQRSPPLPAEKIKGRSYSETDFRGSKLKKKSKKLQRMFRKLALIIALSTTTQAAPKPNIIYILTDDMGWGDYGVFFQNQRKANADRAEPWHMTPELDKMAAGGLQLRHFYCPAPVCAPSRASLLMGVHQGHSEIRDNQFDKALPQNHTIATVLKSAGYSTAAIGKWGLQGKGESPAEWQGYPTKHGFDFFHGYVRHKDGHFHYPKEDGKEVWENDEEISSSLKGCYTTDLFTARAKQWITDQKKEAPEKPFFLYLAYDTPHAKTQVPSMPFPEGGLKWTGKKDSAINTAGGTPDTYIHPDYANATWDHDKNLKTPEVAWPNVYKGYATMVRRIDDCIGDLIGTLKDLGIDDNTLIVFTTDNGPSNESYLKEELRADFFNSFGPFDGIKRDVIEGGIRVGALLRWPAGSPPDRVSDLPCQAHDWMPTFAELAGVPTPARADGTSLIPTITGKADQKEPQVYVEYENRSKAPGYPEFDQKRRNQKRGQMQAIRFEDFIGVRYRTESHSDAFEIYNMVSDPKQLKNLTGSMPEMQKKMHDAVLRMRRPEGSAPRPYDKEPVPSVNVKTVPGIEQLLFSEKTPWLARLDDVKAVSTDIIPTLNAGKAMEAEEILIRGFIEIPEKGAYTFHLPANSTALLRIHDATVIDAAFAPSENESSGTITLAKGKHPFRLFSKTATRLEISGGGLERQQIPGTMLGH
jgi:arylsulfatase A-like enzyme